MGQLKRLFLITLALTFIGGVGTGAYIGTLTAAPPERGQPDRVERRVQDFTMRYSLTASQVRQLTEIIASYDRGAAQIRKDLSAEQLRRLHALQELSKNQVREILTPEQRANYDKVNGRR